jgi:hypothetical protein
MTLTRTSSTIATVLLAAACFAGGKAAADQVIPDDLIVQGSICTGFDCVNNEAFGSDTIILKENQLRILFLDTSAAGFPSNDWRLIANDATGAGNLFAIEDVTGGRRIMTLEAGAATNSIFVDSTGRVGFRTSTPVLDLHVATSNTPALRLEQNNSGGFTAQTWDIGANEANFFVRDVTGGSKLSFRIRPGAPTSSLDISANGNVGVGLSSTRSYAKLEVKTSATTGALIGDDGGTLGGVLLGFSGPTVQGRSGADLSANGNLALNPFGGNVGIGVASPAVLLHTTGGVRFAGVTNCGSGIVSSASGDLSCLASSRQFKNVAGDLPHDVALANVMALRPQTGSYKETPDVPEHWLIAEEVGAIDPALIGLADGKPYVVKTQNVLTDLIAVVQQQQREIDELKRSRKAQ